ncbi:MAG: D-Ala-D-Ala carboxypeptidase family metallohydrolase, partial [Candidatus Margulisiibacteriota bacterium]
MLITKNFTWEEFTLSQNAVRQGLNNEPGPKEKDNILWLCKKILEPIRLRQDQVTITSGYRGSEVNRLIGGASTSQHCFGEAADITVPYLTTEDLFLWIIKETK